MSDRRSWTKMGHELEADIEGRGKKRKAKYRKELLGTGSVDFDKGSD